MRHAKPLPFDEAVAFINSIPLPEFRQVEPGLSIALVEGPRGLTLVRDKDGARSAIEVVAMYHLLDMILDAQPSDSDFNTEAVH